MFDLNIFILFQMEKYFLNYEKNYEKKIGAYNLTERMCLIKKFKEKKKRQFEKDLLKFLLMEKKRQQIKNLEF